MNTSPVRIVFVLLPLDVWVFFLHESKTVTQSSVSGTNKLSPPPVASDFSPPRLRSNVKLCVCAESGATTAEGPVGGEPEDRRRRGAPQVQLQRRLRVGARLDLEHARSARRQAPPAGGTDQEGHPPSAEDGRPHLSGVSFHTLRSVETGRWSSSFEWRLVPHASQCRNGAAFR